MLFKTFIDLHYLLTEFRLLTDRVSRFKVMQYVEYDHDLASYS